MLKYTHAQSHIYAAYMRIYICMGVCTYIHINRYIHTTHIGMWVYMDTWIYTCIGAHTLA